MHNDSWLCFDCREVYRRPHIYAKEVNCALCNYPCHNIGHQVSVPPKQDSKAWEKLKKEKYELLLSSREASEKENVRLKHDLEQGELRIKILENSKDRLTAIKKINKQLKKRNISYGRKG